MPSPRFKDTGRFVRQPAGTTFVRPSSLPELLRCMNPEAPSATPIRIRGAGSAATDCNTVSQGTVIDMTGLDRIINIDAHNLTVTAEAGVRLGALVNELAAHGLELIGNHEQTERTLGGALASPCMGPGIGGHAAYLSSQVLNMKVVTAAGRIMKVSSERKHLLNAFRLSYGVLGVIAEATLRVRPMRTFAAKHRGMPISVFADVTDRLAERDIGFKFYLLPHKDRVYLDLRRYEPDPGSAFNAPWKIKDWGESTVLPNVFKSLSRVMPIPSVRYRLMDSISSATYDFFGSRLVRNGNNATATGRHRRRKPSDLLYSSWCFPATDFSVVIKAYTEFCRDSYAQNGFRCDLPSVGFRLSRDGSSLLSPSFDEPAIVLQATTTQAAGWEDFVIDFAQFAENWGGIPVFSQSRAARGEYARQMYGQRLEFFRKIRRQLDPRNRLLNPFLAQYFA